MVKKKTETRPSITLDFRRTGNSWIDAGVVGLYRILMGRPPYVKSSPGCLDAMPGLPEFSGVKVDLKDDRLLVMGPSGQVQTCLETAYDRLVASYYDISSRNQLEEKKRFNFYWDPNGDRFVQFPKKRAAGAALLLYDKQAVATTEKVEWVKDPKSRKKRPGMLPPSHAHLQQRLTAFLIEHGLKAGPNSGMLVGGPNEVRPKMRFSVNSKQGATPCFLTGAPMRGSAEAKNTAFPLFGGSRSFVNGTNEKLRIGWQLDFAGKFAPAVVFFCRHENDLHLFFPEGISLRRVDDTATALQRMVNLDPNLFRNFELHLGGYFQGRSEVAVAFFHRVFEELSQQVHNQLTLATELDADDEAESLAPVLRADTGQMPRRELPELPISARAVYDSALRAGPVAFAVVSAARKGNVWMARDYWTFHDLVYLARLFEKMQQREELPSGRIKTRCRPRALMNTLIDFSAKKDRRTLLRDRVCERVLHKGGVLALLERQAFTVFAQGDLAKPRMVGPLLDFAVLYEIERHEGVAMKKEDYEKMVERATWLGRTIADGVADASQDAGGRESTGRAKGAFFRLRKTRSTTDFLDELARLQNRYPKISLPPDFPDAAIFNHASFEEFRGFCVVSALSRFQWKTANNRP
jgi:hypothetical protein